MSVNYQKMEVRMAIGFSNELLGAQLLLATRSNCSAGE